jgi:hypothetical protein
MKIAVSFVEVLICGSRVKRQARWAIISYRSPKSPTVIEHFNCFARSAAYPIYSYRQLNRTGTHSSFKVFSIPLE